MIAQKHPNTQIKRVWKTKNATKKQETKKDYKKSKKVKERKK